MREIFERKHASTRQSLEPAIHFRRKLSLVVLFIAGLGFILTIVINARVAPLPPGAEAASAKEESTHTDYAAPNGNAPQDFSRFSHRELGHARLPCLLCHRREDGASARPKLPGHTPCAGCHAPQFAAGSGPLCAICHTDERSGALKAFPPLQSFNARFDHARHSRGAARPREGCAACHRPTNRGVALSIPTGFNAHTTCYQCHAPRAEGGTMGDISSCGTCHQLGRHVRVSTQSGAYRVNFSHSEHGSRQRLNCNDCHSVRAAMPRSRQVSAPVVAQHSGSARAQSCMSCHNGQRAFGGRDDFSSCKRCHEGQTFRF